MSNSRRESTLAAMNKFIAKSAKSNKPKRTNQRPEKIVECEVIQWLRNNQFFVHVVESKAVWNAHAGRYLTGQTVVGFPDVVGCTAQGLHVAIELKAPGRLSTLRPQQAEYLRKAICRGCFAVVVDSVPLLISIYEKWVSIREREGRITYLLSCLPKKYQ